MNTDPAYNWDKKFGKVIEAGMILTSSLTQCRLAYKNTGCQHHMHNTPRGMDMVCDICLQQYIAVIWCRDDLPLSSECTSSSELMIWYTYSYQDRNSLDLKKKQPTSTYHLHRILKNIGLALLLNIYLCLAVYWLFLAMFGLRSPFCLVTLLMSLRKLAKIIFVWLTGG